MQLAEKNKILYVDDEECTLRTFSMLLSSLGYAVVAMQSSADALDAFSKEPEQYDLVITDYNMPGISGCALSERLLEIRPKVPIILYTGYGAEALPEKVRNSGISAVLTKPVGSKELAGVIRRVLSLSGNKSA